MKITLSFNQKLGSYFYRCTENYQLSLCEDKLHEYFEFPENCNIDIILSTTKFNESYKLIIHNSGDVKIITSDVHEELLITQRVKMFLLDLKVKYIYVGLEIDS